MRYLKVVLLVFAVVVVLVASTAQAFAQMAWNNRGAFSIDRNPNGSWTYGCINREGRVCTL